MKNHHFPLAVILLFSFSCSKSNNSPVEPDPVVIISKSELFVGTVKGSVDSFTLESNVDWKLITVPESVNGWLEISKTNGSAGTHLIKFKIVAENNSTVRKATIDIKKSSDNSILKTLSITQRSFDVEWSKVFGGTSAEFPFSITKANTDNGIVVAGSSASLDGDVSSNNGQHDFWILKLNVEGNKVWEKAYGGSKFDQATGITNSSNGYIVAGTTTSDDIDIPSTKGKTDYLVVAMDENGVKLWAKTFGGSGEDYATCITRTADGNFVVAGYSNSIDGDITNNHNISYDMLVIKFDPDGNKLWSKNIGGIGLEQALAIAPGKNGSVIITGSSDFKDGDIMQNFGSSDICVVKLNSEGNILWQKSLGGSSSEASRAIVATDNEELFVTGATISTDGDFTGLGKGNPDGFVYHLDINGNKKWVQIFGGSDEDEIRSASLTDDNGLFMAGQSRSTDGDVPSNKGFYDSWFLRLDKNGKLLWTKSVGGSSQEKPEGITLTQDKQIVVCSLTGSTDGDFTAATRGFDFHIVKFKN
jgi:hypothetical protein